MADFRQSHLKSRQCAKEGLNFVDISLDHHNISVVGNY